MTTKYGIKNDDFYKILDVFKQHSHEIESAVLFGSRARGDEKATSDIDIALRLRVTNDILFSIIDELNSLDIIYTIDIINYSTISNSKLKHYIDTEGKVIFSTDETGGVLLNINKVTDKFDDLRKALKKLNESSSRDPYKDDIILDATIQRFEFTFELSWKLMKAYLEYNGNLNATSPRSAIREAFKVNLLADGDIWIKMLGDRNRTSHTYDEDCAFEIFNNIKTDYLEAFQDFINKIQANL